MIETVRLSQDAKEQLIQLKRRTGLKHWNVLCRWGLCRSLAEESTPPVIPILLDSNVEMTWKTFAGSHAPAYEALLKARCLRDGLEPTDETVATQFRLHLHRGIGYLFADRSLRDIRALAELALAESPAA